METRLKNRVDMANTNRDFQDAVDHVEVTLNSDKENGCGTGTVIKVKTFTLNSYMDARLWFEKFLMLASVFKWDDERTVANFAFYVEDQIADWLRKLKESSNAILNLASLKKKFLEFVEPAS